MKDVEKLAIRPVAGGCALPVKAVPGASRDRIVGVLGQSLKVAVAAPPERGKANAAVAALLAAALGLEKRRVRLLSGPTSPRKEFLLEGLSTDELRRRFLAI